MKNGELHSYRSIKPVDGACREHDGGNLIGMCNSIWAKLNFKTKFCDLEIHSDLNCNNQ